MFSQTIGISGHRIPTVNGVSIMSGGSDVPFLAEAIVESFFHRFESLRTIVKVERQ